MNHEAERRAAIPANVIHQAVLRQGDDELLRSSAALAFSGLAGGLSISVSFLTEALLQSHLPDTPWRPLLTKLGYPTGFLILVLGRQQLFTENTLTAVIPLLYHRNMETLLQVARLWTVVLLANLVGGHLAAWTFANTSVVNDDVQRAMEEIGRQAADVSFGDAIVKGVVAGWLIALVVWLTAAVETGKALVIIVPTYIVGLGSFTHIIVGSVEVLYLVMNGSLSWWSFAGEFAVPTLLGNIAGGVTLVAALNHAQVFSGNHDRPNDHRRV